MTPAGEPRPTDPDGPPPHGPRSARRPAAFAALLAASAALFVVAWTRGWVDPAALRAWIAGAGTWAAVAYVPLIAAAELLWVPRMVGLVAGGLLFGPLVGGLLSVLADLASACAAYLGARYAARDWLRERLRRRPAAETVVRVLAERKGVLTVAILRVSPLGHFNLVSLACGMTGVPLRSYLAGTALGIVPGAVLYPLLGSSLADPTGPVFLASQALVLVALVLTVHLGRRWVRDAGRQEPLAKR